MSAIRLYREKTGLTQIELAEKVGVVEMTIRRWESGLREPRASDIKKLCSVLGVTESELLNGPQKNEWEIRVIIEAGERKPNLETAISIARILGAKVEELFATQTTKAAQTDGQAHKVK